MATFYEKTPLKLGVGEEVTHYDDGTDGHPEKMVTGKVTEVGDESFEVQWEDLEDPTEYEWAHVTIKGMQIFENKRVLAKQCAAPEVQGSEQTFELILRKQVHDLVNGLTHPNVAIDEILKAHKQ